MIKVKVTVKGIAPLLFNRFPTEDSIGEKKQKRAALDQEAQVERSLYRNKSGKIYQPAEHFVGAMVKAGTSFKLEGKKTYKEVVKGGVFVEPMEIIHSSQKYEADWRSVVNPTTRGRLMKGRGRMNEWELDFTLICIDPRATVDDLKEILTYAGSFIGVGDYRPRYGRFEVVSFKEIK